MNFQQFATTSFGTKLWMGLGRWLPPPVGHRLANVITAFLARQRESSLYRILYANQSVVLGADATPNDVDLGVRRVLRHAGMGSYDLMHLFPQSQDAIRQSVQWSDDVWGNLTDARASGRGIMLCGIHLSNFNLGFLSLALRDWPIQVLSFAAESGGGFQIIAELRSSGVLEDTPISPAALRAAIKRLRAGGTVVTGIDWPVPIDEADLVPFFGREAYLPTGHVRMALNANALMVPIACRWSPERGYFISTAPAIALEVTGDRQADVIHNARRVLAVCEQWIAAAPDQWLMYHPVWDRDIEDNVIGAGSRRRQPQSSPRRPR